LFVSSYAKKANAEAASTPVVLDDPRVEWRLCRLLEIGDADVDAERCAEGSSFFRRRGMDREHDATALPVLEASICAEI
jgi:hypothetical protein